MPVTKGCAGQRREPPVYRGFRAEDKIPRHQLPMVTENCDVRYLILNTGMESAITLTTDPKAVGIVGDRIVATTESAWGTSFFGKREGDEFTITDSRTKERLLVKILEVHERPKYHDK